MKKKIFSCFLCFPIPYLILLLSPFLDAFLLWLFVILSIWSLDVFLLWLFVSNWCWVKVTLSYIGRIKVYFHVFMFLCQSYLTLLSCALYNRFELVLYLYCKFCYYLWFHVSSAILSGWVLDVFLLWQFVSNWCWVKVTLSYIGRVKV